MHSELERIRLSRYKPLVFTSDDQLMDTDE